MVNRADVQRFIMWLSGSVTVFGFIATLVAYLIYGGNTCPQDSSDDNSCADNTIASRDNTILKIIGPVFMVSGILTIISIRCWQNNSRENVVATNSAVNGDGNTAFEGTEFDCGSPPSYSEALHMRIVVEGNVTFPSEPPPKYDDLVAVVEQETPRTPAEDVPSGSQGNQGNNNHNDSINDNNDENVQGNVESVNTQQTREAEQGNGRQEETPTADGVNGRIIVVDSEESAQQRSGETTENNTITGLQEQFENEASSQNQSEASVGSADEILV